MYIYQLVADILVLLAKPVHILNKRKSKYLKLVIKREEHLKVGGQTTNCVATLNVPIILQET